MPKKFKNMIKKCRWCDKQAKIYSNNGRNKRALSTCGSDKCLKRQYSDKSVNQRKLFKGDRTCQRCGIVFSSNSAVKKYCKVCVPTRRDQVRMYKYGLSIRDVKEMEEKIGGICPICLRRPAKMIDHNHNTGEVRGLLCGYCNSCLGLIENIGELKRAIEYLKLDTNGL